MSNQELAALEARVESLQTALAQSNEALGNICDFIAAQTKVNINMYEVFRKLGMPDMPESSACSEVYRRMYEAIGLIGGAFFAVSGIPTAYVTARQGRVIGIPVSTAWLVFSGAVITLFYLYLRNGFDWVITLDYVITILTWATVLRYYYLPRSR